MKYILFLLNQKLPHMASKMVMVHGKVYLSIFQVMTNLL